LHQRAAGLFEERTDAVEQCLGVRLCPETPRVRVYGEADGLGSRGEIHGEATAGDFTPGFHDAIELQEQPSQHPRGQVRPAKQFGDERLCGNGRVNASQRIAGHSETPFVHGNRAAPCRQGTGRAARRDRHTYEALADGRAGTEANPFARRRGPAGAGGASIAAAVARPLPTLPWCAVCFISFLLAAPSTP